MANNIRVVIQKPVDGGSFVLENGNGTTANGNAVDLGGALTKETTVGSFLGGKTMYFRAGDTVVGDLKSELEIENNGIKTEVSSTLFGADEFSFVDVESNTVNIRSVDNIIDREAKAVFIPSVGIILNHIPVGSGSLGYASLKIGETGNFFSSASGHGLSFIDRAVDEANVTWATDDDHIPSIGMIKDNTVQHSVTGEPTGSDPVLNMVSLTQAEYDAGTPIATTLYVITD